MTIFYIPNPTQYINLTTILTHYYKQQIRSFWTQLNAFRHADMVNMICLLKFNPSIRMGKEGDLSDFRNCWSTGIFMHFISMVCRKWSKKCCWPCPCLHDMRTDINMNNQLILHYIIVLTGLSVYYHSASAYSCIMATINKVQTSRTSAIPLPLPYSHPQTCTQTE